MSSLSSLLCGFFACSRRAESFAILASRFVTALNKKYRDIENQYSAILQQKAYTPKDHSQGESDGLDNVLRAYDIWRNWGVYTFVSSVFFFAFGILFSSYIASNL